MKRTKGFTLIELLVVVAIIALLVSILMPALSRARELANRAKCSSQVKGVGTACHIYANDNRDSFPKIARNTATASLVIYNGPGYHMITKSHYRDPSYNKVVNGQTKWETTLPCNNASMYLLVRYADMTPGSFVCPSTSDKEMSLSDIQADSGTAAFFVAPAVLSNWTNLNCFDSFDHLSYSYADVYNQPLTASSSAAYPVLADMNPCGDTNSGGIDPVFGPGTITQPDMGPNTATFTDVKQLDFDTTASNGTNITKHANSKNHNAEMNIVLFLMGNVKQSENPLVGVGDDNIYTHWVSATKPLVNTGGNSTLVGRWGEASGKYTDGAQNKDDTYLVN